MRTPRRRPATRQAPHRTAESNAESTTRVCRLLLVLAWVLAGLVALVTLIQLAVLLDAYRPPTSAVLLVLGYGALLGLLAWVIPTYLARVGLTLVDIQTTSAQTSQSTTAIREAAEEELPTGGSED